MLEKRQRTKFGIDERKVLISMKMDIWFNNLRLHPYIYTEPILWGKMVFGKPSNRLPVESGLPAPDSYGAYFTVLDVLHTDNL